MNINLILHMYMIGMNYGNNTGRKGIVAEAMRVVIEFDEV